jgi:hypothetical protein
LPVESAQVDGADLAAELSASAECKATADAQKIVLEASDIEQIHSDCGAQ